MNQPEKTSETKFQYNNVKSALQRVADRTKNLTINPQNHKERDTTHRDRDILHKPNPKLSGGHSKTASDRRSGSPTKNKPDSRTKTPHPHDKESSDGTLSYLIFL
jgi:hypothetical protein